MRWSGAVVVLALLAAAQVGAKEEAETCASERAPDGGKEGEEECGCAQSTDRDGVRELSPESGKKRLFEEVEDLAASGKVRLDRVRPSPLIDIPGGVFTMGTDDPEILEDGEGPARKVKISPFQLEKFEVSNLQFMDFVHRTKYVTEAENFGWSFCFQGTLSEQTLANVDKSVAATPWWVPVAGASWLHPEGPDSSALERLNYPVAHVSYNDAKAYCEFHGRRLPREAEFERASRGGEENLVYAWGDELYPDGEFKANLWQGHFPDTNEARDGYPYACPVDAFGPQNKYGLHNIAGNVWEWVADAWTTKHMTTMPDGGMLEDPLVEIRGRIGDPTVNRVKRGGSYMCHISYCYRYRVAARTFNTADSSAQNLGFRCAKDYGEEDDIAEPA